MTKALLSQHGVEFDALDVENDPEVRRQFRAAGFLRTPVVVVGDRHLVGWNPSLLAALVGFDFEEPEPEPEELLGALRVVLDGALRAIRQIPDAALDTKTPGRDRSLRQLAHHLIRVVEAGVDADVTGEFPAHQWLADPYVPAQTSAERIARFGNAVSAKFEAWYAVVDPVAFGRTIDADVGPRTLTQVLQRTRSHAGQHLRQLYAMLERCGVEPADRVTTARLRELGLDLPEEVF